MEVWSSAPLPQHILIYREVSGDRDHEFQKWGQVAESQAHPGVLQRAFSVSSGASGDVWADE